VVAVGGNVTHPEEIRGTANEPRIMAAQTGQSLRTPALLDDELIAHVEEAMPAPAETATRIVAGDA
jgi:hypothetical protein